jgi:hypothetical protein
MIKNQEGQSTVEFILTFAFGVSLILVVFNTAMNYATGYLVQYATFMASRVYLTADNFTGTMAGTPSGNFEYSKRLATETFNSYRLSVFNIPNSSFNLNEAGFTDPSTYLTVGAYTKFELTIDPIGKITGQQKLEMVSESFLGKEPTRAECAKRTCFGIKGDYSCARDDDITTFDNGC